MKLPKVIYAKIDEENIGTQWLNAGEDLAALVGEDMTTIGVYELKATRRLKKVVQETSPAWKARSDANAAAYRRRLAKRRP